MQKDSRISLPGAQPNSTPPNVESLDRSCGQHDSALQNLISIVSGVERTSGKGYFATRIAPVLDVVPTTSGDRTKFDAIVGCRKPKFA